jgi:hypothetical protein
MKEQRRRTTADVSANPCAVVVRRWSVVGRANAVIPATSGRPESDGAGRFTTKAPRDQEKTHREVREVREKRFHHKGAKARREGKGLRGKWQEAKNGGKSVAGNGGTTFRKGGTTFRKGGTTFGKGGATFRKGGETFRKGGETFRKGGAGFVNASNTFR